jgi:hypothetical protein
MHTIKTKSKKQHKHSYSNTITLTDLNQLTNQKMNDNHNNEPYATYVKICTNLAEEYRKCSLEKTRTNTLACNDKLYLIQKICMKPSGFIHMDNDTIIQRSIMSGRAI